MADWQHTTQRLAEVEARMSAVLDELGLTRLATSIPGLSAVGAAAILAQDPRPAAVRHRVHLIKHAGLAPREKLSGVCVRPPRFGRTDCLRAARRRGSKRPPGRQPDVLCLSIAAEPAAAIAVLGADFSQASVTA
jgi:transposase